MNCTVCGKPHTKEQPLTVIEDMVPIGQVIAFCPGCLKERDKPTGETGRVAFEDDALRFMESLYGRSPVEVAEDYVKSRSTGLKGTIKIGDVELPIESFEMTGTS